MEWPNQPTLARNYQFNNKTNNRKNGQQQQPPARRKKKFKEAKWNFLGGRRKLKKEL